MTINGPAPMILAMFLNTAIDQQLDEFRDEHKREPSADEAAGIAAWVQAERARHGAGRHPEGRPGPEHLHLLDRVRAQDDGRHRRILRRQQGAELLLGVDLRLSHRRGRREPDLPARLHALQRLHLRRVLSRARHEDRRLRAEPVVLLLQRHGPGIHGDRPRRAAHLGGGDARQIRRQRALAKAEVPRPDERAARCTRRRCSSTTSAPRCRR